MAGDNPFSGLAFGELLETVLPDFILAFTFFTALSYAALGRHFDQRRPAVAMSGTLGLALAVGLAWWEHESGWSIRSLGPIAVMLVLAVLGIVLYRAIKPQGGTWAGVGIAVGVSVLIARVLGVELPIRGDVVRAALIVALGVGILGFLFHQTKLSPDRRVLPRLRSQLVRVRRERQEVKDNRHVGNWLGRKLRRARENTDRLVQHPQERADVVLQIRRMLPAEGWLTERMARLRATAHQVRNGHVARLKEMRQVYASLPPSAKKKAAADLASRYQQCIGSDDRLERLDLAVAESERRIKALTREAEGAVSQYDHARAHDLLKEAERLQKHNSRLFGLIDRTERKLGGIVQAAARSAEKSES